MTVLLPGARVAPLTVSTAFAVEPDAISATDPSEAVPAAKTKLPVGGFVPLTGVTVAVNCVVALCAMLAQTIGADD